MSFVAHSKMDRPKDCEYLKIGSNFKELKRHVDALRLLECFRLYERIAMAGGQKYCSNLTPQLHATSKPEPSIWRELRGSEGHFGCRHVVDKG